MKTEASPVQDGKPAGSAPKKQDRKQGNGTLLRALTRFRSWVIGRSPHWLSRQDPQPLFRQGCRAGLAALIHQLSQPLTALSGSLELALVNERGVEDCRQALERSFEQASRLARLVRSVRELIESENASPRGKSRFDEELLAVVEDLQPLADSLSLCLSTRMQGPVWVPVDSTRLRDALQKIIQTALQRSPRGTTVDISLENRKGMAGLTVSDQGRPPSREEMERLLEPYYCRQEPPASAPGTGLEWAIARRLVESAGGTVRLGCQAGQGCFFQISLPRDSPGDR